MAVVAPITGVPLRTPIDHLEDVSCWIDSIEGIVELTTEEPSKEKADRALFGALYILKQVRETLSDAISDLMKERRDGRR